MKKLLQRCIGEQFLCTEQFRQGHTTKSASETPQELAPTRRAALRIRQGWTEMLRVHGIYFVSATEVWSWMIRQPARVLRRINVKTPEPSRFAPFCCQRPKAIAASRERILMSRSEKVVVPMAAGLA